MIKLYLTEKEAEAAAHALALYSSAMYPVYSLQKAQLLKDLRERLKNAITDYGRRKLNEQNQSSKIG